MKKCFIIEETTTVTYFHKVFAENREEARDKFYNDEDVEYNIRDEYCGDCELDIYEEKNWKW